jgi:hypothetical protein
MKTKTILSIIAIFLLGLTSKSTSAADCIDFQDTTEFLTIAPSQTNFGATWYSNNGVTFSSQYFDWTTFGDPGVVHVQDHVAWNYTGANGNSNFVGNIFFQFNSTTQIDFSALAFTSKRISFDVNHILNSTATNPYLINGQPLTSLPAGITYTATPLMFGFHIELTGNINTLEIHGQEVGVDNMCTESLTAASTGCTDINNTTFMETPANYNNDALYPVGSAYLTVGDLSIVKPLSGAWSGNFDQSTINVTSATEIMFHGYLEFNVSASATSCKELTVMTNYPEKIIVDGDTVSILFPFATYAGSGFTIDSITGGFKITGSFNAATFYNQTHLFYSACLNTCATGSPSACIDFQDTTEFLTIAPSQTNFGATWYSNNGVTFSSQYFDWTTFGDPGVVHVQDHVAWNYTGANGNSNFVGNIFFQFNSTTQIDFSALAFTSKKIEFDVNYMLNSGSANPYFVNGQPLTNLPAGVTYTATPLAFGYHIVLTGNINTIEIHGQETALDNMCVEIFTAIPPCSVTAMFTYAATNSMGTFTNTSSVTAANATQFIWDFGDGTTSGDNDPVHTFGAPGIYGVCLTVVDMNCPNNPTAMYCDSVIIGNCQSGQMIITPNQDGLSDNVDVVAGSKIYDRNGFLVKHVTEHMKWSGKNDNNQALPMGYYTIICPDNGVFNVTIVK